MSSSSKVRRGRPIPGRADTAASPACPTCDLPARLGNVGIPGIRWIHETRAAAERCAELLIVGDTYYEQETRSRHSASGESQ